MKKITITFVLVFVITTIFAQTEKDEKVAKDVVNKFISANINVNNYDKLKKYLSNNSIKIVDERTGLKHTQKTLKKYFSSFDVEKVNSENIEIYNYDKKFGYTIEFDRIIENEATEIILKCKFVNKNEKIRERKEKYDIRIYRIIIEDQDIIENIENSENPAYFSLSLGMITNSEIVSDKLKLSCGNFNVYPINISFGHQITGAEFLKGVKFNYGFSFIPPSSKILKFKNLEDKRIENSFPFEEADINEITFLSPSLGTKVYLIQLFPKGFAYWKERRWDFFLKANIAWNYYKFSSNKIYNIKYNFIIQSLVYNAGCGLEWWYVPSLRSSFFIDFSYYFENKNTYTDIKIPHSIGFNIGIKYNFY